VTANNPFKNSIDDLRRAGAEIVEHPKVATARKPDGKQKAFAIVPLDDDWGYQAVKVAGSGFGIVLYTLSVQRMTGKGEVPITATIMRRCGVTRKIRWGAINRLVKAGLATVKYRGSKHQGCPLLTLVRKT
jgi:hypothetical protein